MKVSVCANPATMPSSTSDAHLLAATQLRGKPVSLSLLSTPFRVASGSTDSCRTLDPRRSLWLSWPRPLRVTVQRDRHRAEKQVSHLFSHMDAELREDLAGLGWWLDTSELTVDETVDRLLASGIVAGLMDR